MSLSIIELPDIILVKILKNIDNIRYLLPALLAHRCFMNAFTSCPGIAEAIIQRQIHRQLLPLAIANIEASYKTYTRRDLDAVKALYLDVFENPGRFTDRLKVPNTTNPLPTSDLIQMGRIFDVIGRITLKYMSQAWRGLMRMRPHNSRIFRVSGTEYLRFFRAFYRLDLFFKLCRGDGTPGPWFLHSRSCFFLLLHTPWELGQMACVYRFLEQCFVVRGAEGLQPHELGLSNEDPRARGNMRSRWIDIWISQGLEFWLLVEAADSRETMLALLASVVKRKYVFFEEMYLNTFPASRLFVPWCKISHGELELDIPSTPYDDKDGGPPAVWIACHCPEALMVDFESNSKVTKLAYLF